VNDHKSVAHPQSPVDRLTVAKARRFGGSHKTGDPAFGRNSYPAHAPCGREETRKNKEYISILPACQEAKSAGRQLREKSSREQKAKKFQAVAFFSLPSERRRSLI